MNNVANDWKLSTWVLLLAVASVILSLACACATPFAALATIAALTLPRKAGLGLIIGAWVANQAVGYLLLGYPQTLNSFAWGAVIGIAAVVAFYVAQIAAGSVRTKQPLVLCAATLIASFAAYEIVLFVAAVAGLGGLQDFAPGIVATLLATNVLAFGLLLAASTVSTWTGFLLLPLKPNYARIKSI